MITMQPRPTLYQARDRSAWFDPNPPLAKRQTRHLRVVSDERPDGIVVYQGQVFKRVDIAARMRENERTNSGVGRHLRAA